jgi:hypothetical protein
VPVDDLERFAMEVRVLERHHISVLEHLLSCLRPSL